MKLRDLIFTLIVFAFLPLVFVYGGWLPPESPPEPNAAELLNISPGVQQKQGGLILNRSGAPAGLIVNGKTGIINRQSGEAIGDLLENLTVEGSVAISGIIKPNDNPGSPHQVITRTSSDMDSGMDWHRTAWMTLVGRVGPADTCGGSQPIACTDFSYEQYGSYCLKDQNYGVVVTVCHKSF